LVGDGILRSALRRDIEQRGLSAMFRFAGLVDPAEIPAHLAAADALVHTSYREGLARALPQALLAERPAISYDIDGAREVVLDGQTGFLVAPGDVAALAARLAELAADPELRLRQGRAGRSRFTDRFRHQTMTRQIRTLYRRLLAEQGAAQK
jgi:glycosyltransferase involved in cell wall biosynthesis